MKKTYHIMNKAELMRFFEKAQMWRVEKPLSITVQHDSLRSLEANKKMWACLEDIARQVEIPVTYPNGETIVTHMDKTNWKHYLSGHLEGLKVVPGIDGGLVMLGKETSKMSIKKMHELTEFIIMFGESKGVIWSNE